MSIKKTGVSTVYGTTNTGSESNLNWPFYDGDENYQITDISISSGILLNGSTPVWDQTGVTAADIAIMPNGDLKISVTGVSYPINIIRITA